MHQSDLETMLCEKYGYKTMPLAANYASSCMIQFGKDVAARVEQETIDKVAAHLRNLGWHRQASAVEVLKLKNGES